MSALRAPRHQERCFFVRESGTLARLLTHVLLLPLGVHPTAAPAMLTTTEVVTQGQVPECYPSVVRAFCHWLFILPRGGGVFHKGWLSTMWYGWRPYLLCDLLSLTKVTLLGVGVRGGTDTLCG